MKEPNENDSTNFGVARKVVVSKFAFKAILMHDPVAFLSLWSSTTVEN